jgi:hypothetical protein
MCEWNEATTSYQRIVGKVMVADLNSRASDLPHDARCRARANHGWAGLVVSEIQQRTISAGSWSLRVFRTGSEGEACRVVG